MKNLALCSVLAVMASCVADDAPTDDAETAFLQQEDADLAEQALDADAVAAEPVTTDAASGNYYSCSGRGPLYILHKYSGVPLRCGSAPKWGYLHILARGRTFDSTFNTRMAQTIGSPDSFHDNPSNELMTWFKRYDCNKSWYLCLFIVGGSTHDYPSDLEPKGVLSAYMRVLPGWAPSCLERLPIGASSDLPPVWGYPLRNDCSTPITVTLDLPGAPDPGCRTIGVGDKTTFLVHSPARGVKRCYSYGGTWYQSGAVKWENFP